MLKEMIMVEGSWLGKCEQMGDIYSIQTKPNALGHNHAIYAIQPQCHHAILLITFKGAC